jgi:hypothetical protein
VRLLPPSRLAGREDDVAALQGAFADALAGRCRGVLVAGKFDPYRRDLEFNAGYQAFRALGRLLLAEPDDELAKLRERIMAALGPNAGLLAAVLPEFATLLAVPPLAEGGLPLALNALARRSPVPVDLQLRADGRLPEPVEISAYYLVAEALTNAAKHARASAVGIEAEVVGDLLRVTVREDGVGGADLARGQRPGRPEGPRGGARRPDRPAQPPRGRYQPARGAPPHRHE